MRSAGYCRSVVEQNFVKRLLTWLATKQIEIRIISSWDYSRVISCVSIHRTLSFNLCRYRQLSHTIFVFVGVIDQLAVCVILTGGPCAGHWVDSCYIRVLSGGGWHSRRGVASQIIVCTLVVNGCLKPGVREYNSVMDEVMWLSGL